MITLDKEGRNVCRGRKRVQRRGLRRKGVHSRFFSSNQEKTKRRIKKEHNIMLNASENCLKYRCLVLERQGEKGSKKRPT